MYDKHYRHIMYELSKKYDLPEGVIDSVIGSRFLFFKNLLKKTDKYSERTFNIRMIPLGRFYVSVKKREYYRKVRKAILETKAQDACVGNRVAYWNSEAKEGSPGYGTITRTPMVRFKMDGDMKALRYKCVTQIASDDGRKLVSIYYHWEKL